MIYVGNAKVLCLLYRRKYETNTKIHSYDEPHYLCFTKVYMLKRQEKI